MKSKIMRIGSFAATALCGGTLLTGCFGIDIDVPPVTITIPLATDATIPDILKNGDKLSFNLPELCDLPDLAALEADVRETLGPVAGLIDIEKVTLDVIEFDATTGNFDFLDNVELTFTKDDESVSLDADLSAQSNITSFDMGPDDGEELDILGIIPGPEECLTATFDFTGTIPATTTVYSSTMDVTIHATLHL